MLVVDAAKEVCEDKKLHPQKDRADIRGIIGIGFRFILVRSKVS